MKNLLIAVLLLFSLSLQAQKSQKKVPLWLKSGNGLYKNGICYGVIIPEKHYKPTDTTWISYDYVKKDLELGYIYVEQPSKTESDTSGCNCTYFSILDESGKEIFKDGKDLKEVQCFEMPGCLTKYDIIVNGKVIREIPPKISYAFGTGLGQPFYIYKGNRINPLRIITEPLTK